MLLGTILLRPYVVVFFLVYLFGCSLHLGLKRTLLFAVIGYLMTWLSEYSSIHNGIPYGLYYYIETTRDRELWVWGVPFMDSISYVFLAYASYTMALIVISPVQRVKGFLYLLETRKIRDSFSVRLLGSVFMVYLDIIIDPVALRGDRWFLGRIYGYPDGGIYFGIPISNFIGWLIVGFFLIYALQKIDSYFDGKKVRDYAGYRFPWRYLIGPALYLGVLVFNVSITFWIGEYTLGWVGVFIILLPSALLFSLVRLRSSAGNFRKEDREAHLKDFPLAAIPSDAS
ncbi:MAG TPA: carotenoid biosynthesis protein [Thermodesulfovibrionales bacterium]|nr:carotenoid biosynthesis protein [Thermodesulfovibrionales bacterium]